MAVTDKLEIMLKFNGKKIKLDEVGENAHPTFKKILAIFSGEEEESAL